MTSSEFDANKWSEPNRIKGDGRRALMNEVAIAVWAATFVREYNALEDDHHDSRLTVPKADEAIEEADRVTQLFMHAVKARWPRSWKQ